MLIKIVDSKDGLWMYHDSRRCFYGKIKKLYFYSAYK